MHLPLVSVVMSVRNAGKELLGSIYSILDQENISFELIVINDGSTDETGTILANIAQKDPRITVLTREARGLTASLIEGCEHAQGEFIARQDAYDYSMPERLNAQAYYLATRPSASMCSSHVRFITKERATVLVSSEKVVNFEKTFTGIIHGSVMFRKKDYEKAGGYRRQFYYAQDVDLWSRLVEIGEHIVVPKVLYENCIYPGSISGSRKKEQTKFHQFIVAASKARRLGEQESIWLAKASTFSKHCQSAIKNKNTSSGAYFIGACLINTHPLLAKKYLLMTLDSNPFHLRARLKILSLT